MSSADLNDLETRAASLGYHYDGLVRVEHPFAEGNQVTWTIVLRDADDTELTFQGETMRAPLSWQPTGWRSCLGWWTCERLGLAWRDTHRHKLSARTSGLSIATDQLQARCGRTGIADLSLH